MKKPTEKRLTKAQRAVFADWMEEHLPLTAAQRERVLKVINPGAQVAQAGSRITRITTSRVYQREAAARLRAASRVRSEEFNALLDVGMAQVASLATLRGQRVRGQRVPQCRKPPGASSR